MPNPTGLRESGVPDPSGLREPGVPDPTGLRELGVPDPTGLRELGVPTRPIARDTPFAGSLKGPAAFWSRFAQRWGWWVGSRGVT